MSIATAQTVAVLGKEVLGNREVYVIDVGENYDIESDCLTTYEDVNAKFPYEA